MRIFALDLSSHAGYAILEKRSLSTAPLLEAVSLIDFGNITLDRLPEEYGTYPKNFVQCAFVFAEKIVEEIYKNEVDAIVVEETVPGQETYSQKLLEFFHYAFIERTRHLRVVYVRTGEWRKTVEARMTKEERKGNLQKNLQRAKLEAKMIRAKIKLLGSKKTNKKEVEQLKAQLDNLQLGKVTRKHVCLRIANAMYNLQLKVKDNDIADAIMLGTAFLKGATICDGKRPSMKQ